MRTPVLTRSLGATLRSALLWNSWIDGRESAADTSALPDLLAWSAPVSRTGLKIKKRKMKACAIILILVVHIHADSVEGPTGKVPAVDCALSKSCSSVCRWRSQSSTVVLHLVPQCFGLFSTLCRTFGGSLGEMKSGCSLSVEVCD